MATAVDCGQVDPLWMAMSKLRRGRLQECITICDEILSANPSDQAAWIIKCKAVIKQNYIDDIEMDEEGVAEMLLDENAVASMPRPGTSVSTPQVSSKSGGNYDPMVRPMSQSGRPMSGFARPSSSRPMSGSTTSIRDALQSGRRTGSSSSGGVARPMTTFGREVRLSTASLSGSASGGALVDVDKLNLRKYASRTGLAMVLTDYLLYVEHNTRKALELCAEATKENEFRSWWWKARLGKCYLKLGLLREAEQQLRSALKIQPVINTYLDLCNARIYDLLNDPENAITYYKKVLVLDASNIESIACLGAHFFYAEQPEISIRYYRRLLQMGVNNTECWNNIGLCCFYSSQYDMALGCFDRALSLADDDQMADVWYNIGHIGISLGDLGLAYQAFKVSVSVDPQHGEALNNIAVLEMRRQKFDFAKSCFHTAAEVSAHAFEPFYNSGDFQEAHQFTSKALRLHPGHMDSKELLTLLQKSFLNS
eukprot:gene32502-42107_t